MSEYIQFEQFVFVEISQYATEFNIYERSDGIPPKIKFYLQSLKHGYWSPSIELPEGHWEIVAVSDDVSKCADEVLYAIQQVAIHYERFLILRKITSPEAKLCAAISMKTLENVLNKQLKKEV